MDNIFLQSFLESIFCHMFQVLDPCSVRREVAKLQQKKPRKKEKRVEENVECSSVDG